MNTKEKEVIEVILQEAVYQYFDGTSIEKIKVNLKEVLKQMKAGK